MAIDPTGAFTSVARGAAGTSTVGTEPASTVQNDILLAGWLSVQTDTVPTIPSGWTAIREDVDGTIRVGRVNIAYIVRGASAPSLTWTHASTATALFIYRIPGVFLTGDPNDAAATFVNQTSANPKVFTGLTTVTDGSIVIAIAARRSAISQGSASTYTERLDMTGDFFVMSDLKTPAGATGNPQFTESDDNDVNNYLIALKPTPSSAQRSVQNLAGIYPNIVQGGGGRRV